MKAKFSGIFLFMLLPFFVFSQSDSSSTHSQPHKPFSDRINVGGSLGLSFGNITSVEIAPVVTYQITDDWLGGLGARYIYFSYNDPYSNYGFTTSIYGGTLLTRYNLFRGFFGEADLELNNTYDLLSLETTGIVKRVWVPSLLLGGGYAQKIGGRSVFFISVLYDVIQDPNSPYWGIPVIRGGISFGL
ncbi:MAG TPA: hypothetical protein VE978_20830 [Chitinophagales bacterium]|nr:hypothetical protein [Chitinophagales bacterium]